MSDTALVLCAGFGTRLGPLTRDLPKPLLDIEGEPLLWRTLRHLAGQGIREVHVNLHYLGDMIREAVPVDALGLRIHFHDEAEPRGTAGTVGDIEPGLPDGVNSLLVVYGDLLTDQPIQPLRDALGDADAALLVHRRVGSNSRLRVENGRIVAFEERPAVQDGAETWVNSGFQLLSRRLCRALPDRRPLDLPRDVYVPGLPGLDLRAVPLTGYRCAIDSSARYAEACAAVREGRLTG